MCILLISLSYYFELQLTRIDLFFFLRSVTWRFSVLFFFKRIFHPPKSISLVEMTELRFRKHEKKLIFTETTKERQLKYSRGF